MIYNYVINFYKSNNLKYKKDLINNNFFIYYKSLYSEIKSQTKKWKNLKTLKKVKSQIVD